MEAKAKILSIGQKIAAHRGRPLLILSLIEVEPYQTLELHNLLFDKRYKTLDVVLQTPGGDIDAAFVIAKMLRSHAQDISIMVPLYAKSAGTLICLGANRLLTTDLSELGPLDTQIPERKDGGDPEYVSALNGSKALEQVRLHAVETLDIMTKLIMSRSDMSTAEAVHLANEFTGQTAASLYTKLSPEKIGEYARALEVGQRYGEMLLTRYMGWPAEKAEQTVRKLVYQYPSHSFAIDHEELISLGLQSVLIKGELLQYSLEMRSQLLLTNEDSLVELVESSTIKPDEREESND